MPQERTPVEIQRDIQQARASLASSIDQLAYRTSPKRLVESTKRGLLEQARTPQGQAVIAGIGVIVVLLVVRRFTKSHH